MCLYCNYQEDKMKYFIIFCMLMVTLPARGHETTPVACESPLRKVMADPPYTWAAKKCRTDKSKHIAARCFWKITNPESTHACIDEWKLLADNTWAQVVPMICENIDQLTLRPAPSISRMKGLYAPRPDGRIRTYRTK